MKVGEKVRDMPRAPQLERSQEALKLRPLSPPPSASLTVLAPSQAHLVGAVLQLALTVVHREPAPRASLPGLEKQTVVHIAVVQDRVRRDLTPCTSSSTWHGAYWVSPALPREGC